MQVTKFFIKSGLASLVVLASLTSIASAGCRTENRFNEFTRTWSTNNVCDFGSAPVGNSWSVGAVPSYAPAYVAPVYTAPAFSWSLPAWVFAPAVSYDLPVYSAPVLAADYYEVPTYLDSGVLQTPVDVWDYDAQSWFPGWIEEPVDRWADSFGDFFTF